MNAKSVVLGVSGSVAAYRAADLARELMRRGFTVRVCLTDAAERFVTRALFEALTGQPCLADVFDEPERGRMAHIDWARQADLLIVAPATASTLAKLAGGVADDMLSTIAVAYDGPSLVAPAMNPTMYAAESVQDALTTLRARGVEIVEPTEGEVACGESGQGKFAAIERIAEAAQGLVGRRRLLEGKRVLMTSGPTREPIDAVRFLSNRSSGKMGAALARAALMMGAEVTVVSGPASAPLPARARVLRVETAEQMLAAALPEAPHADWIVGAAAVADYRPRQSEPGKIRRSDEPLTLELIPNPDIISALAAAAPQAVRIAFAAEHGLSPHEIVAKYRRKGVDALAVNDVSRADIGFESSENELSLYLADRIDKSGKQSKLGCALWLFETVALAIASKLADSRT